MSYRIIMANKHGLVTNSLTYTEGEKDEAMVAWDNVVDSTLPGEKASLVHFMDNAPPATLSVYTPVARP